ncbi:MAG: hypothetical protein ACHQNA_04385 [Acidimicrobiales bacterium]
MHAVVNRLQFSAPIDPALFADARKDVVPAMRAIDGFEAFHVIQPPRATRSS